MPFTRYLDSLFATVTSNPVITTVVIFPTVTPLLTMDTVTPSKLLCDQYEFVLNSGYYLTIHTINKDRIPQWAIMMIQNWKQSWKKIKLLNVKIVNVQSGKN